MTETVPAAVQEGINANSHVLLRDECPYDEGLFEHQPWLDGWDEAEHVSQAVGG